MAKITGLSFQIIELSRSSYCSILQFQLIGFVTERFRFSCFLKRLVCFACQGGCGRFLLLAGSFQRNWAHGLMMGRGFKWSMGPRCETCLISPPSLLGTAPPPPPVLLRLRHCPSSKILHFVESTSFTRRPARGQTFVLRLPVQRPRS